MLRKRTKERGSALVEGALIILPFLVVFIGMADFGYLMFVNQTLTERARSAARAGAVLQLTSGEVSQAEENLRNQVMYGTPTAGTGDGIFGLKNENVEVDIFLQTTTSSGSTLPPRVRVTIKNLDIPLYTPLYSTTVKNVLIRVVLPMENNITTT